MRARQRHWKAKSLGAFIALDSRYINESDGTSITTWSDLSGSANDASQATAADKPVYKTAIVGGNGVVRFDGTSDFMETTTIVKSQPYTVFNVVYPKGLVSGYNEFFSDSSLGCTPAIAPTGTSKYTVYAGALLSHGSVATLNAWAISSCVVNSTSSSVTVNGAGKVTGNAGTTTINGTFQLSRPWNKAATRFSNDEALNMVISGAASDSLRRKIESHIAYSFKIACS